MRRNKHLAQFSRKSSARRVKNNRFHAWDTVIVGCLMLVLIASCGHWTKMRIERIVDDHTRVYAQEVASASAQIKSLNNENTHLQIVAKVATAEAQPVWITTDQAKALIAIVIPQKSAQDRFYNIISKCENGPKMVDGQLRFNPLRINENKDKQGNIVSYDLGFAQVNSAAHADSVEKLFGEDFDTAMKDPAKNIMFAAWLYQHAGNFSAWLNSDHCDVRYGV